jgi:hypothetical protein
MSAIRYNADTKIDRWVCFKCGKFHGSVLEGI